MITVTTETIEGKKIVEVFGLVQGSTVRTRHLGKDIMAALKSMGGGEISEYSELLSDARNAAVQRMMQEAEGLGANAVVGMRFATSEIQGVAAEILAYGTAAIVE
jgi:uncharacterized protein YbjQ (UPF0145 family)